MWQRMKEVALVERADRAARHTYELRILSKCLGALRGNVESEARVRVVKQITGVMAAVKAFESLKQNRERGKIKHALNLRAMVHRATTLKLHAFRAFDKSVRLRILHQQLRQKHLRAVAGKYLAFWEYQLQLKLWRKDAFQMCRIVLTRQALKKWRSITQQDSLTERAYLFQ